MNSWGLQPFDLPIVSGVQAIYAEHTEGSLSRCLTSSTTPGGCPSACCRCPSIHWLRSFLSHHSTRFSERAPSRFILGLSGQEASSISLPHGKQAAVRLRIPLAGALIPRAATADLRSKRPTTERAAVDALARAGSGLQASVGWRSIAVGCGTYPAHVHRPSIGSASVSLRTTSILGIYQEGSARLFLRQHASILLVERVDFLRPSRESASCGGSVYCTVSLFSRTIFCASPAQGPSRPGAVVTLTMGWWLALDSSFASCAFPQELTGS
ncbi:hypothetical protein VTI74DRAFT_10460 [Chaetomium olivicolor]